MFALAAVVFKDNMCRREELDCLVDLEACWQRCGWLISPPWEGGCVLDAWLSALIVLMELLHDALYLRSKTA